MVRAAALTYTVILSVVPLLALGTAVLKGLGAGDQIREAAYTFIANFETSLTGEYKPVPLHKDRDSSIDNKQAGASVPAAGKEMKSGSQSARLYQGEAISQKAGKNSSMLVHIKSAVDQVFDYVDQTNFATIGIIGILGLLVVVISLLDSIEEAINAIWKPVKMRPFGRRFMDYAAMLIIFPIAVNVGFAAIAAIQSQVFLDMAMKWFPFKALFVMLFRIFPVLMVIATFTLLYRFLPNTKVEISSAVSGGIVGGVIWLIVQVLYLKLQVGVARYNAIYGSFATFPLVLIWIYLGWLAFLVGAEVSCATQNWRKSCTQKRTVLPAEYVAAAMDITVCVLRAFRRGKTADITYLAERTGCDAAETEQLLARLENAAVVRKVKDAECSDIACFVPAAPEDRLSAGMVFSAVMGEAIGDSWGSSVARKIVDAGREAVAHEKWPEREE